jgi:hypothetical protein
VHLGAVDRHHPNLHHPGLGAEREHLAEQAGGAASWRWRKRAIVV